MTTAVPSKDMMSLFEQLDLQAVAQLAQRADLNQIISTLGAMDPQDIARLLQRFRTSDEREPPSIEGDFYEIAAALTPEEREVQLTIRDYMERVVRPVIAEYWERGEFPRELLASFAEKIGATVGAEPYDFQVANPLLLGIAFMEMARVDPSMSTFFGVHWGLCMGSIALFGSEEQRVRWLPPLQRFAQVGSWALTEPEVGSATAAGLSTTARREGDTWIINGVKKWSGNTTFADVIAT
jgi:glutaryl-CoA dehydrogenase